MLEGHTKTNCFWSLYSKHIGAIKAIDGHESKFVQIEECVYKPCKSCCPPYQTIFLKVKLLFSFQTKFSWIKIILSTEAEFIHSKLAHSTSREESALGYFHFVQAKCVLLMVYDVKSLLRFNHGLSFIFAAISRCPPLLSFKERNPANFSLAS